MCVSASLGALVSIKYLVTSYNTSKVIVHGRPGLTPRHRDTQFACGYLTNPGPASIVDPENLTPADQVGLTDRCTSSQPLVENAWELHEISLENGASASNVAISPMARSVSQSASTSMSAPVNESAHVPSKRLCRTPSDLESLVPAELLYAPQVHTLRILYILTICCTACKCGCSAVLGHAVLGAVMLLCCAMPSCAVLCWVML